ncbi:MAG: hypothetical protein JW991_04800 [Candidatus Pacebacteria bacterium]|nr:hypothetical protein [Candidatus Paceibacterota bacterium]
MLEKRGKYLQVALNSTLDEARKIINQLPLSDRILIEAGTPLLKTYGQQGLLKIKGWWQEKLFGYPSLTPGTFPKNPFEIGQLIKTASQNPKLTPFQKAKTTFVPYLIADYKAMDRGATEVSIASRAGANAITVLGQAPTETIDALLKSCERCGLDPIIDMMNVQRPYQVLRKLKKLPPIVMLHRGVDETETGQTRFPIHLINQIKGAFDVMIAIGGGDTLREVQSAIFNGADIVMVWKEFYQIQDNTTELAAGFLKEIK